MITFSPGPFHWAANGLAVSRPVGLCGKAGRNFAVERQYVTCEACVEALGAALDHPTAAARLLEALQVDHLQEQARGAYVVGAMLVVELASDAEELRERFPGLRVVHADKFARRGILESSGFDLRITPRAVARLFRRLAVLNPEA